MILPENALKRTLCTILSLLSCPLASAQVTTTFSISPEDIGVGSSTTFTYTITNNTSETITDMALHHALPDELRAVVGGSESDCDGDAYAGWIPENSTWPEGAVFQPPNYNTLSWADLAPGGTCQLTAEVRAVAPGAYTLQPEDLTWRVGTNEGNEGFSTALLVVEAERPGISSSFGRDFAMLGQDFPFEIEIDNTFGSEPLTFLDLLYELPSGLPISNPPNFETTCGGLLTSELPSPDATLFLAEFEGSDVPGEEVLAAGEKCTIAIDVVATALGEFLASSGNLAVKQGSDPALLLSGFASSFLEVVPHPLVLNVAFLDDPIPPDFNTVLLEYQLLNLDSEVAITDITFSNDLSQMADGFSFDEVVSITCDAPIPTLGDSTITVRVATLAPNEDCRIRFRLGVPNGLEPTDVLLNTTSGADGTREGSAVLASPAQDRLGIVPGPRMTKEFLDDPVAPGGTTELEWTITNTASDAAIDSLSFSDFFPAPLSTASAVPGNDCCGIGSTCSFTAGSASEPATFELEDGLLPAAGSCTFSVTFDVEATAAGGIYPSVAGWVRGRVNGELQIGGNALAEVEIVAAPLLLKSFSPETVGPGDTATLEFTLTHSPTATADATAISFSDDLDAMLSGLTATLPASPDPPCGAGSMVTGSSALSFSGATLAPGDSCTWSVTVNVPAAAPAGTYTNTTSAVSSTVGGLSTNSVAASAELEVTGLQITHDVLNQPLLPGEVGTLRFTFANLTPAQSVSSIAFVYDLAAVLPENPDLTLSGSLPSMPCGLTSALAPGGGGTTVNLTDGSLAVGQECTFEFDVLVPPTALPGAYQSSTGSVSATIGASAETLDAAVSPFTVDSRRLELQHESSSGPVAPGEVVTVDFYLRNQDDEQAVSMLNFTVDLASVIDGMSATGLPMSACGGTVSGTSTIDLTGGSLAASGECSFAIDVMVPAGAQNGLYSVWSSPLAGLAGALPVAGDPSLAVLHVLEALGFERSFAGPAAPGGSAMLTYSLSNPRDASVAELTFSDNLFDLTAGAMATNLPLSGPCGTLSSVRGTDQVALVQGSLEAFASCSFDVEIGVPAETAVGLYESTSTDLLEDGLFAAPGPNAQLTVVAGGPPGFSKAFEPSIVELGQTTTMVYTVDHTGGVETANSLAFLDVLPLSLLVATVPNAVNTCGGSLAATPAGDRVELTGGSIAPGSRCTIQVDLQPLLMESFTSTSGDLTSSLGNSGSAEDTVTVVEDVLFVDGFELGSANEWSKAVP